MKSTFKQMETKSSRDFPKLMINSDSEVIILATKASPRGIVGMVVYSGYDRDYYLGEFSRDWDEESFEDYYGIVTLEDK